MRTRRGFTLLELIIVMGILGILFVFLLRTYNLIATMVFRVQQEKEVAQEITDYVLPDRIACLLVLKKKRDARQADKSAQALGHP